jgi:hypothetical protein
MAFNRLRAMHWWVRQYQNPDRNAFSKNSSSNSESQRNECRKRAGISNVDADTIKS